MENTPYAVEVDHVSMRFRMSQERIDNLKEYLIRFVKRSISYNEFYALEDVSFNVRKGGMFGLLGLNGAGKSTLLKVIAGVLKPTCGEARIYGTIAPLIELGAGFDIELTAEENIFLNGAVLGYPQHFMREKKEEILDFAELQEFRNVPIKNFSSGMNARLAFSIATCIQPDILISDEILSVGDYKFQEKCLQRIHEMMAQGTTVLFVSHSLEQVRENCTEAIILEKGRLILQGEAREVCDIYEGR